MNYKYILFDLDGTLINTLADLSNSMNYGLKQLGQPVHSHEECRKMIGSGVRKFAQQALPPTDQDLVDELLNLMRDHYRQNCTVDTVVYGGINELLAELDSICVPMAVVTNKDEDVARAIVRHYFGDRYFKKVAGAKDGVAIKPDPAVTLAIAEELGFSAEETLFVGDSDIDMLTGTACGMKTVGVSWGFRDSELLKQAGADVVVDEPAEIVELLA
ncbi:Phosphoglycolate phosphatase [Anaerohalosphaera lusitana]|uniref:phosphoglycolate phosphatase n=1 Tax=Anaerohalosphaera lusitana TaxID=1936003 RepID=A0A1U9NMB5_9BACT|nr:HAD family hydrolase [Anaerohalosphaera lusitana]AQT69049.1 Phosphoglycolate phosphatase [Anaerohalosphaera lusitana]